MPHHVTIIPQYILFKQFNWIDTYYPLTVPKWLATDAFFIFLMVQFIRGLPKELDESATIDGRGQAQIYLRIILPLAVPALITTAIFTFIWTWDDFFSQSAVFEHGEAVYDPAGSSAVHGFLGGFLMGCPVCDVGAGAGPKSGHFLQSPAVFR
ncbi:carbohydrate ABC transporter permease [Paenibacillus sp. P25]|nr:carbohydrate ABC transporter permease [Paenibacillus sp. P25]